jgi:F-type H+/Na+-transporting ATPase subunit alpha
MQQTLNPTEISDLIRKRVEQFEVSSEARTEGTVVSVSDGICRLHGLADVMQGEMIEFPGDTYGLALNLERDSVGAVVMGDYEHIKEGDTVRCTGRILEVPVGVGCWVAWSTRWAIRSTAVARSIPTGPSRSKRSRRA